jgi:hypothetical protein
MVQQDAGCLTLPRKTRMTLSPARISELCEQIRQHFPEGLYLSSPDRSDAVGLVSLDYNRKFRRLSTLSNPLRRHRPDF